MDLQNLKEAMLAYQAVYDEDLREEFEEEKEFQTWINSLVEEGYDLSEYTWEEVYEQYLSEMGQKGGRVTGSNPKVWKPVTTSSGPAGGGMGGRRGTPGASPGRLRVPGKPAARRLPSEVTGVVDPKWERRFAGARDAAFKKAQAIKGSPIVGPKTSTTPTVKPAATAKPTTTAKPAPSAPTAKPTATAKPTPAPAAPAPPAVKKPSLASQAAELRQMQASSRQRQGLTQSFDLFDLIKGYLIDEGYADTEDSALAIMANMSEEWRQSIIIEAISDR